MKNVSLDSMSSRWPTVMAVVSSFAVGGVGAASSTTRRWMNFVQLPKASSTRITIPPLTGVAVPFSRMRDRVSASSASRPILASRCWSASPSGSSGCGRAEMKTSWVPITRANPGGPISGDAHTR